MVVAIRIALTRTSFRLCEIYHMDMCTKTPIYTGTETDTHAHCIPGRVAGRNDLSYIVNSGKTHCQCYKLN